jgi:hypothetical protein
MLSARLTDARWPLIWANLAEHSRVLFDEKRSLMDMALSLNAFANQPGNSEMCRLIFWSSDRGTWILAGSRFMALPTVGEHHNS